MGISILSLHPLQFLESHKDPGAVLLLPFVVSCINLAVPRFYSAFRLVEQYEMPQHEVSVLLIRYMCLVLPYSLAEMGTEFEVAPLMLHVHRTLLARGVAHVCHAWVQADRAVTILNIAVGHAKGKTEFWRVSLALKCSGLEVTRRDVHHFCSQFICQK